MYEKKTEYVILNNMLEKVTSPVSKEEGTLVYDALSPVANELAKHYIELDSFIRRAFIQTSHSQWLDLRGCEYGLYRKQPTTATVDLVFTGDDGTTIPEGFRVQTIDGKQFETTKTTQISGGQAIVSALASQTGKTLNVAANSLTQMSMALAGVTSVTNPVGSSGGTDTESDDDFKQRILDRVRNPGASGNINHYIQWAMEVDGVGAVRVFPLWNGAGTVKVAILDSNRLPATQAIVDAVALHVESERPIGASVTVVSGTLFSVTIEVDIDLDGTMAMTDVQAAIKKAVEAHLKSIAYKQAYISYSKLSAIILATNGVADHKNLTINGLDTNVNVPLTSVAVLSEIIIA